MTSIRCHQYLRWGIVIAVAMMVTACSKKSDFETKTAANEVVTDSQIPPGLPPQYFPPQGFVWSGFKSGNLPAARYGVAAPPTNSKAHILILADAAFPAEVYFELANQLISKHYTVWIFEAPGQGGSGRYLMQGDKIHTPDHNHSTRTAQTLIETVIRPDTNKPLYLVANGTSAITATSIDAEIAHVSGVILNAPYFAASPYPVETWQSNDVPDNETARIGHRWQKANPDLRLRAVSQVWQNEMDKAAKSLMANDLPSIRGRRETVRMLVISTDSTSRTTTSFCRKFKSCNASTLINNNNLHETIDEFIRRDAPKHANPSDARAS